MCFVSAVYFSNWSVYATKHFAHQLPVDKLSHVFYAFMKIDMATGTVSVSDPWADLQMPMVAGLKGSLRVLYALKKKHRGLKVIMSIGGWGTHDIFTHVMKDKTRMTNFVVSCIELVDRYKFDGIDIDWEYPQDEAQATQLVYLLGRLREHLNQISDELDLTVAAPAGAENIANLLVSDMNHYVTFWNIMCYDFAGEAWSTRTGYHANLYGVNGDNTLSAESVIDKYISLGVPPHKLVLGMPMYGRSFSRPSTHHPGCRFAKRAASSEDVIDFRSIDRSDEVFDDIRVAAFKYDEKQRLLVTYDNPECTAEKAKFVIKRGLRGGFWWDSKGDTENHSLVSAFVNELNAGLDMRLNYI